MKRSISVALGIALVLAVVVRSRAQGQEVRTAVAQPPGKAAPAPAQQPGAPPPPGAAPGQAPPAPAPGERKDQDKASPQPAAKPDATPKKPPKPRKPADPKQLQVPLGPDGKIAFNLSDQPWEGVLQWLADLAECSLVPLAVPDDYVDLKTRQRYTVEEALDVINGILLGKKFTLLRHGEVLYVTKLEGLDSSLVPRVLPEDLNARGNNELVKVVFPLNWLVAEQLEPEVKSLLSPHGKVTALKATNRLEVLETAGNLRRIRDLLQEEQANQQQLVREFRLKHARAEDVAPMLKTLLGIKPEPPPLTPEQQQQMMQRQPTPPGQPGPQDKKEPEVRLAVDSRRNSILINGSPDKIAIASEAIKVIDVPQSDEQRGYEEGVSPALTRPRAHSYHLSAASPEAVVKVLKEMGGLSPSTSLSVDSGTRSIIAWATPADHTVIQEFVDLIDGSGRRFEVIQLTVLDAEMVAGSIEYMMKGKKPEPETRRPYYFFDSSRQSQEQKSPAGEFQVEADVERNMLLLRATEVELREVKELLAKMGENPDTTARSATSRVIPVSPDEVGELLRAIEQLWPGMNPENPLRTLRPQTPSPKQESSQPQSQPSNQERKKKQQQPSDRETVETTVFSPREETLGDGSTEGTKAEAPPARRDSRPQASPLMLVAAVGLPPQDSQSGGEASDSPSNETAADSQAASGEAPTDGPDADASSPRRSLRRPAAAPGQQGSPVTILPGPAGLMISCPDPAVLDRMERLIASLAPAASEFTVFYLRKAYAEDVADILKDMFKEDDESNDMSRYRSYWYYDYYPSDKKETTRRLSKRKPLKIIPDPKTNSLLVRASAEELAEIRGLLTVLDKEPPKDADATRTPQLIPVHNTTAKEVAAVIEDVYRDHLSASDPARGGQQGGGQATRVEYQTVFNYGSGASRSGNRKTDGILSVGVDERTNTLIVTAPKDLLAEIEQVVRRLDEAALKPRGVIRVVGLKTSTPPKSVQSALSTVLGRESPQRPKEQEGAKKPGETGNPPAQQQKKNGSEQ